MQKSTIPKKNMLLYFAAGILCLTLFSCYFLSGLYARYSTGGAGADSARTAGFSPAAVLEQQSEEFVYDPAKSTYSCNYNIKLTNASEVAVTYDVVIAFRDKTLSGAEFAFGSEKKTVDADASALTFLGLGELQANDTEGVTKTMTVTVSEEFYQALIQAGKGESLDLTAYFELTVTFTQAD
jgi:hypothetical protein